MDRGQGLVRVEALAKARRIQPKIRGILLESGLGIGPHIFARPYLEQAGVILPEPALLVGAFGRLCGPGRLLHVPKVDHLIILVRETHLARLDVFLFDLALRA